MLFDGGQEGKKWQSWFSYNLPYTASVSASFIPVFRELIPTVRVWMMKIHVNNIMVEKHIIVVKYLEYSNDLSMRTSWIIICRVVHVHILIYWKLLISAHQVRTRTHYRSLELRAPSWLKSWLDLWEFHLCF